MSEMMALPSDHPMMVAWNKFCETDEGRSALLWAVKAKYDDGREIDAIQREQHVKGAMWLAFTKTWGRIAELERERDEFFGWLQRYQPPGSPPPGAGYIQARWIVAELGAALEQKQAVIDRLSDAMNPQDEAEALDGHPAGPSTKILNATEDHPAVYKTPDGKLTATPQEQEAAGTSDTRLDGPLAALEAIRDRAGINPPEVIASNALRNYEAAKNKNAEARIAELGQELQALVSNLRALMAESRGVDGLHLNGDLADWEWLEQNEWLAALPNAEDALVTKGKVRK